MITRLSPEVLDKVIADKKVRAAIAGDSHWWFMNIYLPHYIKYPPAPLHDELLRITEDTTIRNAVIVAFRGSAKSTIMTLSFPIWSIIGKPQKKFIVIIGRTMPQAKMYLKNIKAELETNELLKADLGPFAEEDEWHSYSLVIPKYGARIMAISFEQGIRGLRHRENRPDLIIADDIEDLEMAKTIENRDKVYQWFTGEVMPSGSKDTKVIVIGNLLHNDSLLKRLIKAIDEGKFSGIYREFPLLDKEGRIAWPGKYPDMAAIEAEKKNNGWDETAWQREFMLKIIPSELQLIKQEWIKYYDELPPMNKFSDHRFGALGVDLAISKKDTADYTAIVAGEMFGYGDDMKIYIRPNPVNERLTNQETLDRIIELSKTIGGGYSVPIYVEDTGYQVSVVEELVRRGYPAERFSPHGNDKYARLSAISHLIQSGRILFPKHGAELLLIQLLGFGAENHDDLVDAFTALVHKFLEHSDGGYTIPPVTRIEDKPLTDKDIAKELEDQYEKQVFREMMGYR